MGADLKKVIMDKKHNSERGIATLEAALLLSIFVVFMTYCVGTFGVIHTGILSSISARAYAFETFRNRTNLTYFRDTKTGDFDHTIKYGIRLHGIISDKAVDTDIRWYVTERTLSQGREVSSVQSNRPPTGDSKENELFDRKREAGAVNPVYIKTLYGICLNYDCGGD